MRALSQFCHLAFQARELGGGRCGRRRRRRLVSLQFLYFRTLCLNLRSEFLILGLQPVPLRGHLGQLLLNRGQLCVES